MAQNDALDQAVANLSASVGTLADNFATMDAAVQEAMAGINNAAQEGDIEAVKAATAKVADVSGKMAADAASLKGALAPPGPVSGPADTPPTVVPPSVAEPPTAPVAPVPPAPPSESDPA